MARMIANRSELKPLPTDWKQVAGYLGFALAFAVLICVFQFVQYLQLADEASQACSTTGAAAKLDLTSFVPLCRRFTR